MESKKFVRGLVIAGIAVVSMGAKGGPKARDFAFRLDRVLAKGQPNAMANIVFSPYSVSQAFLLANLGARGMTRKQIEANIDLKAKVAPPSSGENAPELSIANRIWLDKASEVQKSYLAESEKVAGATPGLVDFTTQPAQAIETINSWVSEQTKGKIQKLIPPGSLNARTRLVLTDAVYFKGPWETPFKKELTKDGDFTLASGAKQSVPFMHQHEKFANTEDSLAQVLELPYLGREFAMLIVLPKRGVALSKVEAALSAARLAHWESVMNLSDVVLSMPRFKFDSDFVLNSPIQSLGVKLAFNSSSADFSGIDGKRDLYVSKIFHKAFISVDEAGTEAAAATAIEMRMMAIMHARKPVVINVDHPFIFMIQDLRSKAVLFIGRVSNPK